jgi:hypothetical protein
MPISTLFFILIAVFGVAAVAMLANFFSMSKKMFNGDGDIFGTFQKGMGFHILFAGLAASTGIGSLITGIIWLVQTFKG